MRTRGGAEQTVKMARRRRNSQPARQRILTCRSTEKPPDQRQHRSPGHRADGIDRRACHRAEAVTWLDYPLTACG